MYGTMGHQEVLRNLLLTEGVCVFCYLVSSLFLLGNSYAGFTTFFFGLVVAGALGLKLYALTARDRVLYGAMLGVVTLGLVMTLMQAILWGQSAGCAASGSGRRLLGVECTNVGAMKSVCTFSVFLFLQELVFLALVLRHKDDLLPVSQSGVSGKSDVPSSSFLGSSSSSSAPAYAQVPQTADL